MEKTLYPLRGIVTTVISCFEGENKVLDLDSVANEIDMACKGRRQRLSGAVPGQ